MTTNLTATTAPDNEVVESVQAMTGEHVELACVDQGYTGEAPAAAATRAAKPEVVKMPQANRGFVLLPRRWVVMGRGACVQF